MAQSANRSEFLEPFAGTPAVLLFLPNLIALSPPWNGGETIKPVQRSIWVYVSAHTNERNISIGM